MKQWSLHMLLPSFACCYGGSSLCHGPAPALFCLDLPAQLNFIFCPQLILLVNWALLLKNPFCLSPLFLSTTLMCDCEIPCLILSVPWLRPAVFISLWCSGSTQHLGAGFPWQEPGKLPTVVMRKMDGESQPDSVPWTHCFTVIRNLTTAGTYTPFMPAHYSLVYCIFLSIFFFTDLLNSILEQLSVPAVG